MSEIHVTQVRSGIGTKPKHRGTLRALGLGRIGNTNTLPDRPEIRGMIARVPHLIEVSEDAPVEPQGSTKANQSGEAVSDAVQDIVEEAAEESAANADSDETES